MGSTKVTGAWPSRVAVVTGAAGAIGSAIAVRLARAGNHVIVTDLDEEGARSVVERIGQIGYGATAMGLDVGSASAISAFFATLDDTFGRCDILINNAAVASIRPFVDYPEDTWQRILDINLTGPMLLAQQAVARMKRAGWGRVVNIASISGIRAGVGRSGYGTSKAALIALTRQIAVELATDGITVNAVAPGPIETALAKSLHSASARKAYLRQVPMRRYGSPDEVAAAVAFFSAEDSAYITGQTLAVDGGFVVAGMLDA